MSSPDPTQFTRGSAERIARVVRAAELAVPAARPLSFDRVDVVQKAKAKAFRVCTYTGAWSIGDTKTVTFKYQTATPNTVSATNLFFPVPSASGSRDCAIAKDGGSWFLVAVPFTSRTAVFVGATVSTALMQDVTLSATLNTSNCTITVNRTLVTTSVTILQSSFTGTVLSVGP